MINKEMNTTDLATVTGGGWKTNSPKQFRPYQMQQVLLIFSH